MKLNIFSDKMDVVEPEKEVYFDFTHGARGSVIVYVCDKDGNRLICGNLIAFYPDGTMKKMMGINRDLGFQLGINGHIVERRNC